MRITPRVLPAALFGGLALALAPASVGGQPVTQPLNPEPPSFYTCKAVGDEPSAKAPRRRLLLLSQTASSALTAASSTTREQSKPTPFATTTPTEISPAASSTSTGPTRRRATP